MLSRHPMGERREDWRHATRMQQAAALAGVDEPGGVADHLPKFRSRRRRARPASELRSTMAAALAGVPVVKG